MSKSELQAPKVVGQTAMLDIKKEWGKISKRMYETYDPQNLLEMVWS